MVTIVWTHNVKEALTGIDGVEQLVNMVLNGEKEGIRQQAQHAFILKTRQNKLRDMIRLLKTTSQSKSKSHSYKVMQRDLPHRTVANLYCQSLIFGINRLSWFYRRTKINHSICKCLLLNQNTGNSRWANFSPDRGRAMHFHSSLLWFDELDAWHGWDFRCCFCALITWRHVNLRREIPMRKKKNHPELYDVQEGVVVACCGCQHLGFLSLDADQIVLQDRRNIILYSIEILIIFQQGAIND